MKKVTSQIAVQICRPFPRFVRVLTLTFISALVPLCFLQAQQTPTVVTIMAVASGQGTSTTNVAPGSIITISGTNLAATTTSITSSTGQNLPNTLGGVQVTIGGVAAPLFNVSPTSVEVQVPFSVATGQQPVVLTNGSIMSAAFPVTVAASAPTLFADSAGALILKASNYSRIGPVNPARAGDVLLLYATGLGQTTPAMTTGLVTGSSALANTTTVMVTVNGQSAPVIYSLAAPGYVGLYQIAVQVTSGIQGSVPVVLQQGSVSSMPVSVFGAVGRAAQLDSQVQAVYSQYQALGPVPVQLLTPQQARLQPSAADAVKALLQSQGKSTDPMAVGSVKDMMVPGAAGQVTARMYSPAGTGPFPIIVYFHGGGFVIATIDTYDASARALTNLANAIVISVEYRKAPENKYPAAAEDAYAAVQWIANNATSLNGIANKIAVAGESAGGNLATVVCMMARDRSGKMPLYQGLIYPVSDFSSQTQSFIDNANAPFLTTPAVMYYGNMYLSSPDDAYQPYASPILGDLHGLPPATVITAGFDPLRDQGAAYATKLREAGIQVSYTNYDAVSHEFFSMGAVVSAAQQANQQVAGDLKTALNK